MLKITSEEFYEMTLNEIYDLLSESIKMNSLNNLEAALYNSYLINNKDCENTYNDLYKRIMGEEIKEDSNKTYVRYRNICKRIGLKYPKELDELSLKKD